MPTRDRTGFFFDPFGTLREIKVFGFCEGIGEEIGGKIQAGVGKLVGNEQMQAEGKAHELSGKAKQAAAKAAERTKGKVQEAVGSAKGAVGAALNDPRIEAEGRAKELEGEARQVANRR